MNEIDTGQEAKEDAGDYVYDIYYRDELPPDWTPPCLLYTSDAADE